MALNFGYSFNHIAPRHHLSIRFATLSFFHLYSANFGSPPSIFAPWPNFLAHSLVYPWHSQRDFQRGSHRLDSSKIQRQQWRFGWKKENLPNRKSHEKDTGIQFRFQIPLLVQWRAVLRADTNQNSLEKKTGHIHLYSSPWCRGARSLSSAVWKTSRFRSVHLPGATIWRTTLIILMGTSPTRLFNWC